jgi:hypothetical protein
MSQILHYIEISDLSSVRPSFLIAVPLGPLDPLGPLGLLGPLDFVELSKRHPFGCRKQNEERI